VRIAVVTLSIAFTTACGGRLARESGVSAGPDAGIDAASDAGNDADATSDDASDGMVPDDPCSVDASYDAALCTSPPEDDRLYASPAVVNVAAGSYGYAQFYASGSWASDPSIFMIFEGSTLPLGNNPGLDGYGAAQSFIFLVPSTATGQTGTLTVLGRVGNVERTASLTVNVTDCQPWPASMVCPGNQCGFQPDNCGGLVSCGTCPAQTPYCAGELVAGAFEYVCSATMPMYCPPGYGITGPNSCIPCNQTRACIECNGGACVGIQDACLCERGG
jgi:hypothetical protein